MSIWINKALAACLLCAGLAACDDLQTGATRSTPVLNGAINIAVPAGYCIDRSAGRGKSDSAVVLMGRCSSATNAKPAVITTTVGAAGSAGVLREPPEVLSQFFTSAQGRAMISRSGRANDVRILSISRVGNAYLIHLTDRRAGEHWRAITGIKSRLISIRAISGGTPPLAPADSRRLVENTLSAVIRANPSQ